MIKYNQKLTGGTTGLGYQLGVYSFMRNLSDKTGYPYAINCSDLICMRNTFSNLKFDCVLDDNKTFTNQFKFALDHPDFSDYMRNISNIITDDSEINDDLYADTLQDPYQYTKITSNLKFKDEIYDKCKSLISKFDQNRTVALHIRRRENDYTKFLIDVEYYYQAIKRLPKDHTIFIFCNSKDYVLLNSEIMEIHPERFVIISDIFNDNQFINCDVGQDLDILVDNDLSCKYDYKTALLKLAQNNLINNSQSVTKESLNDKVRELVKELHPTYKYKIKNNLYNYSFDFCLMTMCKRHIISNSLFSLWGAILAQSEMVIYPKYWRQPKNKFVRDLAGFDQSKEIENEYLNSDFSLGIENPDQRSFIVNKK